MLLTRPRPVDQAPLQLEDLPAAYPGPGEVRLKIRCCGICHTDLHTVEGDLPLPSLPLVPGHQVIGIVESCGKNVHTLKDGDRVGVPWLFSTDQTCGYCRRGLENLCDHARFTGYHVNGGYAESMVVREDYAFLIPKVFSDEHAAPLLCAGIIGYRSHHLSGIGEGQRLGLYGFGASAHLVLQLARYRRQEVYVFTRAAIHRTLAKKLGAAWVGDASDAGSESLDHAIIFAPAGGLVPQALRALKKAGSLTLAGITMSEIPAMDYSLLYQERTVRSVANSTRRDAREFLELAGQIPIESEVRLYPLESANQALLDLKHSRLEAAGVLQIAA